MSPELSIRVPAACAWVLRKPGPLNPPREEQSAPKGARLGTPTKQAASGARPAGRPPPSPRYPTGGNVQLWFDKVCRNPLFQLGVSREKRAFGRSQVRDRFGPGVAGRGRPEKPFRIFDLGAVARRVGRSVNPQVAGSSPARGAGKFSTEARFERPGFLHSAVALRSLRYSMVLRSVFSEQRLTAALQQT